MLRIAIITTVASLALAACSNAAPPTITPSGPPEAAGGAPPASSVPAALLNGETLYVQYCAECHGPQGTGTEQGPPLIHVVYEPGHHGDAAFMMAAMNGVQAHHWQFGDMAPVEGITPTEVEEIVPYVRWLQREAGIQ